MLGWTSGSDRRVPGLRYERTMPWHACDDGPEEHPCPACHHAALDATSLETLFESLRALVDALTARREVFAIIESEHPSRYVQVLADCDGALLVEVSSIEATDGSSEPAAPTLGDEAQLGRLRFEPPDDFSPNWHRIFVAPWPWPAPVVAELMIRALVDVLDASLADLRTIVGHTKPGISVVRP